MSRRHRPDPTGAWHHVMSRGVNRGAIFFGDDDRLLFGALLAELPERFGVEIHAYCLMSNHFHLLVHCPSGGLSDAMHYLLSVFARSVNHRNERVGHLFGDRFVSRWVTTHNYLANVVRYIHRNPLDIAGIGHPRDYRWSSHRHYLGIRPQPSWLTTETIGSWFADADSFESFVCRDMSSGSAIPLVTPDRPGELSDAIDLIIGERLDLRTRRSLAARRAVGLALLDNVNRADLDPILDELGLERGGALRSARHRARSFQRSEPAADRIVLEVRHLFDTVAWRLPTDARSTERASTP